MRVSFLQLSSAKELERGVGAILGGKYFGTMKQNARQSSPAAKLLAFTLHKSVAHNCTPWLPDFLMTCPSYSEDRVVSLGHPF